MAGVLALGVMPSAAIAGGDVVDKPDSDRQTSAIETGSINKDVQVAPVRRVFPKTPTDRELRRMVRQADAKPGKKRKGKKR